MPYTSNKRYSVQTAASNTGVWGAGGTTGDDLNTGVMGLLDTQLAGLASFSVSSSNVTLSYANVQSCMLRFSGVLLASIVVSPDASGSPVAATYFNGFYYWENVTTGSFTITLTTGAGSVVLPQGRRGIVFVDSSNGPRIVAIAGSSPADPIPSGSNMTFYNAAAPSGWTLVALDDYDVRISTAGGSVGGSTAYSSVFTGRTISQGNLPAVSFNGTYAHTHQVSAQSAGGVASGQSFLQGTTGAGALTTTQPNTASISVSSGGSGTAMDFSVRYVNMLLATRN